MRAAGLFVFGIGVVAVLCMLVPLLVPGCLLVDLHGLVRRSIR